VNSLSCAFLQSSFYKQDVSITPYRSIACAIEPPTGAGLAQRGDLIIEKRFSGENRILWDRITGIETSVPPIVIGVAAPGGAPPRRVNNGFKNHQPVVLRFSRLFFVYGNLPRRAP
jgi:hypothetical protein